MGYSKQEYKFVRFVKSKNKRKKYSAILQNKKTKREVKVDFGAIKPYEQYKDSTGLGLYSKYGHNDKKRRDSYRARHKNDNLQDYSACWFAWKYLW
jgi:hypothetical protein